MLLRLKNIQPIEKMSFIEAIKKLPKNPRAFRFFPFANEINISKTIELIEKGEVKDTSKLNVAILIGESNIISMLSAIERHAGIVICNDINSNINLHTQFMIDCLRKSKTREEYETNYNINNPVVNTLYSAEELKIELSKRSGYTNESYFLFSEERYLACKSAAHRLEFVWTAIDFVNIEECQLLASTMQAHNAVIKIINLNNVHHYDEKKHLPDIVSMFSYSSVPYILYSTSFDPNDKRYLHSKLTTDIDLYLCFLNEFSQYQYAGGQDKFMYSIDPKIQELVDRANEHIVLFSKELGLMEGGTIPTLKIDPVVLLFPNNPRYQIVLHKGLDDALYLSLLKSLLPYWGATWYFTDEDLLKSDSKPIALKRLEKYLADKNSMQLSFTK